MKKFTLTLFVTLLVGVQALFAQNIRVTGTVRDASGQPLLGVSVMVAGSNRGTTTATDGTYNIEAPANGSLDFTFVGMAPVQIPVNNRTMINVQMENDAQMIDDVIVVAYGTARRSSFTGSASSVSADALRTTTAETIDKALVGKVSGIRVSQVSGDPGAGGQIQVRGIGSITGSTAPLYVVDGMPITTESASSSNGSITGTRSITSLLTSLNSNDIESITVLKDAAAASLYGSRAANGVVIITTKKGNAGKPRISFNASVGWSEMATNSYEMMNGVELHDFMVDLAQNSIDDGRLNISQYGFTSAQQYVEEGWEISRKNGEDWRDYIYDGGTDQNYQVSVSGGSETSKYYIGLGYQDMTGLVRGTSMKRYSATFNTSSDLTKWFTLEGKAQLTYAQTRGLRDSFSSHADGSGIGSFSPTGILSQANPSKTLRDANGNYNEDIAIGGSFKTPAYELGRDNKFLDNNNGRALINANAEIRFTDYLKFRTVNGVDFMDILISEYWGPNTGDGRAYGGMAQKDTFRSIGITSSNTLQFSKTFGGLHNVDALGGYEVQSNSMDYTMANAKWFSSPKLPAISTGVPDGAGGSLTKWAMSSFLLNANYNYDNKYYVGANVRSDKSSRLSSDNRTGTFWSVSGAWRFSRENFLIDNPVLTDAKIRASYGTNGTLPHASYGYMALYYFGGIYGPNAAIYPSQPENPELGWEMSKNFNLGIDFTLFNRFTFNVEYYSKYTEDLLMDVPVSYGTGFSSVLQNNGNISNKGIDFEFHGNNIVNSNKVIWNSSVMLSTQKSVVEKLPNGEAFQDTFVTDIYRYEEGKDLYSMYAPTWAGVDPQTGKGQFLIDPSKPATSDNLTTSQTAAGRSIVAKAYPDVTGSWNNTLSWNGLTLNVLMTYQFGGNLYDYWGYFNRSDGRRTVAGWNQAKDIIGNYWKKPGDIVDNPRPTTYSQTSDLVSSRWIKSSDFIRLKEISLSYSLPTKWFGRSGIEGAEVSVSVNNLAFIYAATKDIELEVPLNGFRSIDTPLARTIMFGLNVNF